MTTKKAGRKTCCVTVEGVSYAFCVNGVNGTFRGQIFERQIDALSKLKAFQDRAEHVAHVRGSQKAVREWVREKKPSQFFAWWISETDFYHDDSVEIFYTKQEEEQS